MSEGWRHDTDYFLVTDSNLLQVSGSVQVDDTDIGKSDHFLVWMELGRTVKTAKQQKRVIKKWRIERFQEEELGLPTAAPTLSILSKIQPH